MAEDSKLSTYPPSAEFSGKAHISSMDQYNKMYQRSITDPEGFWADIADTFEWKEKGSKVLEYTFQGHVDVNGLLMERRTSL
jgi:hypothetical protein